MSTSATATITALPNAKPSVAAAAAASKIPAAQNKENGPTLATLLPMTRAQLLDEANRRGITGMKKSVSKDEILCHFGFPVKQWKAWRKMKVADLKPLLKARGLKVTGSKDELLSRLGVPLHFGETSSERSSRKTNEMMKEITKKRKAQEEALLQLLKKAKNQIDPEDDPNHMYYSEDCCENAKFPVSYHADAEGCIVYPDGSIQEVHRFLSCGGFPKFPNAPPIQFLSDDDCSENGYEERPGDCHMS